MPTGSHCRRQQWAAPHQFSRRHTRIAPMLRLSVAQLAPLGSATALFPLLPVHTRAGVSDHCQVCEVGVTCFIPFAASRSSLFLRAIAVTTLHLRQRRVLPLSDLRCLPLAPISLLHPFSALRVYGEPFAALRVRDLLSSGSIFSCSRESLTGSAHSAWYAGALSLAH